MYKRLVSGLFILGAMLLVAPPAKASTQDFTISSFSADYYVSRDQNSVSEMRVRERIIAEFPDFDQNHGILRAIPESYDGHSLELHVDGVFKENTEPWNYSTYSENGNTVLKIGDADTYVRGKQVYLIDYRVRGPVNIADGNRLFWDVNGDQWAQPFGEVTARIHMPRETPLAGEATCVTGSFGSVESDCAVKTEDEDGGKVITITTLRPLRGAETLTFSIPFANGAFAPYTMSAGNILAAVLIGLAVILPSVVALIIVVRAWRKYGRDAKGRGVVVPQYIPPKEVSVLGSSAVLHQMFKPEAISAIIIDLAVRHYVKVYETGKKMFGSYKYDLELVKAPDSLRPEEKAVVEMLFETDIVGTRVSLETLSKKLYTQAQKIGEGVDTTLTALGYFVRNPRKARAPFFVAGGVLAVVGFIFPPYTLGFIPAGLICLIGAAVMAAPTAKGAELKEYLLGLKKYMELAEAERLKVLQAPQGRYTDKVDMADKGQLIKLYERLLPYAMLFGIEREWSKQFASLYDQQPDWYSGTGTFNAVYFATAMHSIDTTMTQSFTPPSSSGSGAGGGGGGGGGGGW